MPKKEKRIKGVKKRKKVPAKILSLYTYIFDEERSKGKVFESCNKYFDWVFTSIKKYNKINKTRFSEDYVLPYVSWKANEERRINN